MAFLMQLRPETTKQPISKIVMSTKKEDQKNKNAGEQKPLKPKNPHTEGAPDDRDPNAQYEDKDES
jgi:hypothetical protein